MITKPFLIPFHRHAHNTVAYLAFTALAGCSSTPSIQQPLDSLTLRELNIVDEHGQARLRLGAPLPDPKGAKRQLQIYGIQFMDAQGIEVGGLAMLDAAGIRGLCFDTVDGYSPMCVSLINGQPQIVLADQGNDRITLGVENGVARVVLNDRHGKPRITLEVNEQGQTRVDGLNSPVGSPQP